MAKNKYLLKRPVEVAFDRDIYVFQPKFFFGMEEHRDKSGIVDKLFILCNDGGVITVVPGLPEHDSGWKDRGLGHLVLRLSQGKFNKLIIDLRDAMKPSPKSKTEEQL